MIEVFLLVTKLCDTFKFCEFQEKKKKFCKRTLGTKQKLERCLTAWLRLTGMTDDRLICFCFSQRNKTCSVNSGDIKTAHSRVHNLNYFIFILFKSI